MTTGVSSDINSIPFHLAMIMRMYSGVLSSDCHSYHGVAVLVTVRVRLPTPHPEPIVRVRRSNVG